MTSSSDCVIVMDCGEGTFGQIVRFYGQDRSDHVLSKIKAVYISHLHADHHLGLIGVLQGRRKALKNLGCSVTPFLLFAPKQITWWLNFYDNCFESIRNDFRIISNQDLVIFFRVGSTSVGVDRLKK